MFMMTAICFFMMATMIAINFVADYIDKIDEAIATNNATKKTVANSDVVYIPGEFEELMNAFDKVMSEPTDYCIKYTEDMLNDDSAVADSRYSEDYSCVFDFSDCDAYLNATYTVVVTRYSEDYFCKPNFSQLYNEYLLSYKQLRYSEIYPCTYEFTKMMYTTYMQSYNALKADMGNVAKSEASKTQTTTGGKMRIKCVELDRIFVNSKKATNYLNSNLVVADGNASAEIIDEALEGKRKTAYGYHWEYTSKRPVFDNQQTKSQAETAAPQEDNVVEEVIVANECADSQAEDIDSQAEGDEMEEMLYNKFDFLVNNEKWIDAASAYFDYILYCDDGLYDNIQKYKSNLIDDVTTIVTCFDNCNATNSQLADVCDHINKSFDQDFVDDARAEYIIKVWNKSLAAFQKIKSMPKS